MLYLASKLVQFLLLPSNLIGVLAFAGLLAWFTRWRHLAKGCLFIAALLLVVLGWSPLGALAVTTLEDRFPRPLVEEPVTGIVVLGGSIASSISEARDSPAVTEAGERLTAAVELTRRYPAARLFLSGGSDRVRSDGARSESAIARDMLVAMGVPAERIALEERSRTTCENAVESKAALAPQRGERWLLVTSANHMPRAVACFRAAGFPVVPYPVDFRTRGPAEFTRPVVDLTRGLEMADLAAHEWLGLVMYRATGVTEEVFPWP